MTRDAGPDGVPAVQTDGDAAPGLRALALAGVPEAMQQLHRLVREAESESVRLSAIKEVFDRGFGRPPAAKSHDDDSEPHELVISWVEPGCA